MKKQLRVRFTADDDAQEPRMKRWKRYAIHRERVTNILTALTGSCGGHLSVWGAGPCMDIDLSQLSSAYDHISLVDIDRDALDAVHAVQEVVPFERINLFKGVDLFGLHEILRRWQVQPPEEIAIAEASAVAGSHKLPGLAANCQVVLSDCVLSQIIEQLAATMGKSHHQLLSMLTLVRQHHLELMLEHTAPEGYAVLMTDFVSSLTAPAIAEDLNNDLTLLMDELIAAGNFFTGCNPYAIVAACKSSRNLCNQIKSIRLMRPWRWQLHEDQVQLVYCLVIQRMPLQVLNYHKPPFLINS